MEMAESDMGVNPHWKINGRLLLRKLNNKQRFLCYGDDDSYISMTRSGHCYQRTVMMSGLENRTVSVMESVSIAPRKERNVCFENLPLTTAVFPGISYIEFLERGLESDWRGK